MNVTDYQKDLQAIKTKEATSAATAASNFRATRRRRSLLTREASNLSNTSIEAAEYHAQKPATVPFVWESSPGTPKRHVVKKKSSCHEIDHALRLPPLTPPPSYMYRNKSSTTGVSRKKSPNDANNVNNLIQAIFPRLSIKRDHPPTLSSSSSTKSPSSPKSLTSSSSSSLSSHLRFVESSISPIRRQKRLSFEYTSSPQIGEEEFELGSPVSPLCFRRLSCCNHMFRGL